MTKTYFYVIKTLNLGVLCVKLIFSKIKTVLFPQVKPLKYSVHIIGHAPFTRKAFDKNIPLVFEKIKDTKMAAGCAYDYFTNNVLGITLNTEYPELWPSSLEHEAVHVDQLTSPQKTPSLNYNPFGFIADGRLIEVEAYARQSYKAIHDYKNGVINSFDDALWNGIKEPMAYMIGMATGTYNIQGNKGYMLALDKVANQSELPEEEDLVFATMYNLALSKTFKQQITPYLMNNLKVCNDKIIEYNLSLSNVGEDKTIEEMGFKVSPNIFSKHFIQNDVYQTLGRNGVDHFKKVGSTHKQNFLSGLLSFTSQEMKQIKNSATYSKF